jgi:hypothetical protein
VEDGCLNLFLHIFIALSIIGDAHHHGGFGTLLWKHLKYSYGITQREAATTGSASSYNTKLITK